jgi:hypothetical protein
MFEFPTTGARPVWIASYPRSGNTFLRIILRNMFGLPSYSIYYVEGDTHGDPSAEALEEGAPLLPRNWRERLNAGSGTVYVPIKTHGPPLDEAPTIFIARDGRAAIHSYFHYHKKFSFEQPSLTEIIAGACQFGSWSDHYRMWQPKTRPNTLLVRYEELVGKPEEIVARLAEFLKLEPQHASLPQFEELQKKLPAFFRRGQNTDYLNEWAPAQMALFNQLHAVAMEELGFPLLPSTASSADTVKELAQSADRLHTKYLEQLTNVGSSAAVYQKEIQRLSLQVHELSRKVDEVLTPLLKTRWVRLGRVLGVVNTRMNREVASPVALEKIARNDCRE